MFWPKNLLVDLERFLVERFGFGVLAHIVVQLAKVIEAVGRVGMFWPKNLLSDPQRFLERFGFGVLAYGADSAARSLRLVAVSGCSEPKTFCRIRSAS